MDAWDDAPYWKRALRPLAPAALRPWLSYGYWVLPQKAWTLAATTARLPLAREPKWPTPERPVKKALMVGLQYAYGKKADGPSYEYAHLFKALQESVAKAEFFDSLGTEEGLTREEINARLEKEADRFKPDLIFIAPFRNELDKALVRRLSENSGALTVAYFLDDVWRFDIHSRDWAGAVHAVASQDERSICNWAQLGHRHQRLMPFGYTPEQFHPVKTAMARDVSFVGAAGHPGRREAVEYLQKNGQRVECFGSGWSEAGGTGAAAGSKTGGRFADLDELPKIFCSSKINLNFSRVSVPWEGRRQVKGRVFEVTGCGGFLLTEYAPGLEDLFVIGKEIDVFRTHEEMLEKVRYYLAHESERAAMAKAGLARAQKEHTYQKRFGDLLGALARDWKAQAKAP